MKTVEYLSPSALALFKKNPSEYYLRYLSDQRPEKDLQTQAMSIGSAFDAYAKSYLHSVVYGAGSNPAYELDALFETQVESHNRDWARTAGAYCFQMYKDSGALADLMLELQGAAEDPRFEFELTGIVESTVAGLRLKGKPDLMFINGEGAHVIYDWKVNGFCGRANKSPMPQYMVLRSMDSGGAWERSGHHKDVILRLFKGLFINVATYLEELNEEWAAQLSTYGWLLGERVGSEIIIGLDQVVANGQKQLSWEGKHYPELRFASHRTRVSKEFQVRTLNDYSTLWSLTHDQPFWFFRDLRPEDSEKRCAMLDRAVGDMSCDSMAGDILKWSRR